MSFESKTFRYPVKIDIDYFSRFGLSLELLNQHNFPTPKNSIWHRIVLPKSGISDHVLNKDSASESDQSITGPEAFIIYKDCKLSHVLFVGPPNECQSFLDNKEVFLTVGTCGCFYEDDLTVITQTGLFELSISQIKLQLDLILQTYKTWISDIQSVYVSHQILDSLRDVSATLVYELFQNAVDTNAEHVQFDLKRFDSHQQFKITHDGRLFNLADVHALTFFADSSKRTTAHQIGHKGIGFKSVFAVTDSINIKSYPFILKFTKRFLKAGQSYIEFDASIIEGEAPEVPETIITMTPKETVTVQHQIDALMNSDTLPILNSLDKKIEHIQSGTKSRYISNASDWELHSSPKIGTYESRSIKYNNLPWLIVRRSVPIGDTEDWIVLCLPLKQDEPPFKGKVHTFLPLDDEFTTYPFTLHAPFQVDALRRRRKDDIEQNGSGRNKWLMKHVGIVMADLMQAIWSQLPHTDPILKHLYWRLLPKPKSLESEYFTEEFRQRSLIWLCPMNTMVSPLSQPSFTIKEDDVTTPNAHIDLSNLQDTEIEDVIKVISPTISDMQRQQTFIGTNTTFLNIFWRPVSINGSRDLPSPFTVSHPAHIAHGDKVDVLSKKYAVQPPFYGKDRIVEVVNYTWSEPGWSAVTQILKSSDPDLLEALTQVILGSYKYAFQGLKFSREAEAATSDKSKKPLQPRTVMTRSPCDWITKIRDTPWIYLKALKKSFRCDSVLIGPLNPDEAAYIVEKCNFPPNPPIDFLQYIGLLPPDSPLGIIKRLTELKKNADRFPSSKVAIIAARIYESLDLDMINPEMKKEFHQQELIFIHDTDHYRAWISPQHAQWEGGGFSHKSLICLETIYNRQLEQIFVGLGVYKSTPKHRIISLLDELQFSDSSFVYSHLSQIYEMKISGTASAEDQSALNKFLAHPIFWNQHSERIENSIKQIYGSDHIELVSELCPSSEALSQFVHCQHWVKMEPKLRSFFNSKRIIQQIHNLPESISIPPLANQSQNRVAALNDRLNRSYQNWSQFSINFEFGLAHFPAKWEVHKLDLVGIYHKSKDICYLFEDTGSYRERTISTCVQSLIAWKFIAKPLPFAEKLDTTKLQSFKKELSNLYKEAILKPGLQESDLKSLIPSIYPLLKPNVQNSQPSSLVNESKVPSGLSNDKIERALAIDSTANNVASASKTGTSITGASNGKSDTHNFGSAPNLKPDTKDLDPNAKTDTNHLLPTSNHPSTKAHVDLPEIQNNAARAESIEIKKRPQVVPLDVLFTAPPKEAPSKLQPIKHTSQQPPISKPAGYESWVKNLDDLSSRPQKPAFPFKVKEFPVTEMDPELYGKNWEQGRACESVALAFEFNRLRSFSKDKLNALKSQFDQPLTDLVTLVSAIDPLSPFDIKSIDYIDGKWHQILIEVKSRSNHAHSFKMSQAELSRAVEGDHPYYIYFYSNFDERRPQMQPTHVFKIFQSSDIDDLFVKEPSTFVMHFKLQDKKSNVSDPIHQLFIDTAASGTSNVQQSTSSDKPHSHTSDSLFSTQVPTIKARVDSTLNQTKPTRTEIPQSSEASSSNVSNRKIITANTSTDKTTIMQQTKPASTDKIKPVVAKPASTDKIKPVATKPPSTDQIKPVATKPASVDKIKPVATKPLSTDEIKPVAASSSASTNTPTSRFKRKPIFVPKHTQTSSPKSPNPETPAHRNAPKFQPKQT